MSKNGEAWGPTDPVGRLGSHYNRYKNERPAEFNDQAYSKNDYGRVYQENAQLSHIQEPDINYSKVEYYLTVSSRDRDTSLYPNGSQFSITLPREFKNVYSIELLQAIIPNQNSVINEPYLILTVDELDDIMYSNNKTIAEGFAMLMLTPPNGNFISIDNRIHENTVLYFGTNNKAKLSKMTIKITDVDGNIFDFGGSGSSNKLYQSTFVFRIVQMERSTSSLNTRNVF
jgi:hypothetical protein